MKTTCRWTFLAFVAQTGVTAGVVAQSPTVTAVPNSGSSVSVAPDPAAPGKFRVTLTATRADTPTTFTVAGVQATQISSVFVSVNTSQIVTCVVRGSTRRRS